MRLQSRLNGGLLGGALVSGLLGGALVSGLLGGALVSPASVIDVYLDVHSTTPLRVFADV